MKHLIKFITSIFACLILVSCGGGSSSGSSTGGGGNSTPVANAATVNMGNISTIPVDNNATNTSIIVTNNLSNFVLLQSATYSLYTSSGAGSPVSTSAAGSPANTSQCTTVQARGTCNVGVSVPIGANQGQYLVTMTFLDPSSSKTYTTSQIVSYSNAVPTNLNGIKVSTINNSVYNQVNGSTTISVPFVLTTNFTGLVATTSPTNPAFTPSISCAGNSYSAGTLCTLYIKISNTGTNSVISGNVIVAEAAGDMHAMKIKTAGVKGLKGQTGYLFNVPLTVTQNQTGNLVTSGVNVVINPSNGTSAQPITLLNNGSATITGITVFGSTPITISSNTCSSLVAGASCTFNINANSTTSGQSSVAINYNNGASSGNTSGSLSFNAIYIASTPGPAMTMTAGQGSLNNVVINTTEYYNILVNNTGNVTLSNITFTTPPAHMAWDSSSTCATNGTQSLAAGTSCTLVLSYSPTSVTGSSTFTIHELATWTDGGGNPQTYAAANLAVTYSAISGNAFLYITPNYVSFAIRADGHDSATQTFTIQNAGYTTTTIDSLTVANPPVTAYNSTGSPTCTSGKVLIPNESCTISTIFGPTTTTVESTSQMLATYKPNSSESDVTTFDNLAFSSSPAAYIAIESLTVANSTGGNGQGSGTPYAFTNTPTTNTQITLTVKYKNSGTESANNFNVALNTLPVGYMPVSGSTTCSYGSSVGNLLVNESCVVVFKAVNASGLYNPYALTGPLNVNIPGYSYTDNATGLNTNSFPTFSPYTNTIYVTANTFATVTESAASWTTAGAGGTNTLTFLTSSGSPSGTTITIPSGQLQGFTLGGGGTCSTVALNGSCTITVTNPSGLPTGTVYFSFIVSPTNAISAGIIQQGTIVYTN